MVTLEQILIIEPQNELRFRGPFKLAPVTSYIKLINPSKQKVYFKIKTTAPKRYCVRPNCGLIKPKQVAQIAVSLQPFDFDPTEKNKHKFMVQSVQVSNDDEEDSHTVWKNINPAALMESKLKCVFENPASDSTTVENASNNGTTKSEANTNNSTNKGAEDSAKSLPKILGETEEKLTKAAEEVNQLRVEESYLRRENLQLKEDLLKLQTAAMRTDAPPVEIRAMPTQSSRDLPSTPINIIIAVIMVILGYLLGKMF